MPTKKKAKASAQPEGPQDPREPVELTPANLAAALKELKELLAAIPVPEPIVIEAAPGESGDGQSGDGQSGDGDGPPGASGSGASGSGSISASGSKAAVGASGEGDGDAADGDAAHGDAAHGDGAAAAGREAGSAPAAKKAGGAQQVVLPQLDLVDAMMHIYFAEGLPCGFGQEALRRIEEGFVDRNEFRVTEAFEVEDLLRDLEIPDLFERCLAVRDSVGQVYNDQNGVNLAFLRDASISDRKMFFQRVPALQPHVVAFLERLLTVEEICFSDKSTLRAQQRFGLDPKNKDAAKFVDELRALLKPYGKLPLTVGPHGKNGKPNVKHPLSPACLLVRLGAPAKKR